MLTSRFARTIRVGVLLGCGVLLSVAWARAEGTWAALRSAPQARAKHAAVYDSHRQRMIVFGGSCYDACCSDGVVPNDLWMLPLDADTPQWVQVWPSGNAPPAGLGPAGIYDPVRDRMLVPGAAGHVWQLALSKAPAWSELAPSGTPPPSTSAAIYDPVRDRLLVVASTGRVFTLGFAADTQWVELLPAGKVPSRIVAAVYDPVGDRMVLFADSVRTLSLSGAPAWSMLTASRPQFLNAYSATYDPLRGRAVIHGGCRNGGCGTTETWSLDLSGAPVWTAVSTSGPLLSSQSAICDPVRDRMVVFGGYAHQFYTDWTIGQLWTMTLDATSQWQDLTRAAPPAACRAPAVRDPVRNRMMVYSDSVRVMELTGLPAWTTLEPAGSAPDPRQDFAAIYDPPRDRMLLYGGQVEGVPYDDLWSLSLEPLQWTPLTATGTPPSSTGPAVYDAARDRMLVVGAGQVWALPLAGTLVWEAIAATGVAPDVTDGFSAVLDASRDRVLVFGGEGGAGFENSVWQLALSPTPAWSVLAPAGTAPAPRARHMAVLDAARDRMVIAAGDLSPSASATDTWGLSLSPALAWQALAAGGVARGTSAIFDPQRDRMVALAACDTATNPVCPPPAPTCWQLAFLGTLGVPQNATSRGGLSLAQSRPNPARGGVTIPFAIRSPGVVTLRVYDLAGRVASTLIDGPLAAGEHVARWDGSRDGGGRVRPGAYFYELRSGDERLQRRLILLH